METTNIHFSFLSLRLPFLPKKVLNPTLNAANSLGLQEFRYSIESIYRKPNWKTKLKKKHKLQREINEM